MSNADIILSALALVTLLIGIRGIKQVAQSEAAIIERFGRYTRTLMPGINFVVPILDKIRFVGSVNISSDISRYRIDLREQIMDIPEQEVITKDNIRVLADTLVFYQITDPVRAVYEISSPVVGIRQLSQTTIRNLFGEMDLDQSLSARESINDRLRVILDDATDKWGIKILRVEIQDIKPPVELNAAMQKQMIAEREKREKVTLAEADKQKNILEAEGSRQKQILEAEGNAKSQLLRAEAARDSKIMAAQGEAESIRLVQEATARGLQEVRDAVADANNSKGVIALETLKAQQGIAQAIANGSSSKIYLPTELAGLLGALGSIKEIMSESD